MEARNLTEEELRYLPNICPRCHSQLKMKGKDLVCNNPDCAGADRADIQHWTAILGEVHGLGGNIKDEFFDSNNINTVEELYARVPNMRFGNSATEQKLANMCSKLTKEPVDAVRALVALNIPRLGWKSAEKIINSGLFSELANYAMNYSTESSDESIHKIEEVVGQATRKSIESNLNRLSRLRYLKGRVMLPDPNAKKESIESKGQVVITGKLSMKRKDFEQIIINAGYELSGKVTKDTVYLITDNPDGSSSKNKAANELGIPKISESEFMDLIK